MTVAAIRRLSGLPCFRCGKRERNVADLYRLGLPTWWTLEELEPSREQGLTVHQLFERGVRVERLCVTCQAAEDGKPSE